MRKARHGSPAPLSPAFPSKPGSRSCWNLQEKKICGSAPKPEPACYITYPDYYSLAKIEINVKKTYIEVPALCRPPDSFLLNQFSYLAHEHLRVYRLVEPYIIGVKALVNLGAVIEVFVDACQHNDRDRLRRSGSAS